jgi:acyl carrier protein
MANSLDQLLSIIVDIAEIEPSSITGKTNYLESDFYDSLFTLSLIAAVDESFGLVLSGSDVQGCTTISELSSLIDSKLP